MRLLAVAIVALLVSGGLAVARIPSANGVITSCYAKRGGAVRVIDPSKGQVCKDGERSLTWNERGPRGPRGPRGAPGPAGTVVRRQVPRTVTAEGNVGTNVAMVMGADGLPVISHTVMNQVGDATDHDLLLTRCLDPSCASSTTSTLASQGDVGQYSSVVVGQDGLPIISYYDATAGDLRVARCTTAECTLATSIALDSDGDVGKWTSITVGPDGRPLVSYSDLDDTSVNLARCDTPTCATATITTLDQFGGAFSSITIDAHGRPVIAFATMDQDLAVAECDSPTCGAVEVSTIDFQDAVGTHTSATLDAEGQVLISYFDETRADLKTARCSAVLTLGCDSAAKGAIDDDEVGMETSVIVGTDGLPLVSYYDMDNDALKLARCMTTNCVDVVTTTLDQGDLNTGIDSAIAIGRDGLPIIAYYADGDLRVIACGTVSCSPHFRFGTR